MKFYLIYFFYLLTLLIPYTTNSQTKKSEVVVISTIHGAHRVNTNYSYDTLFNFINGLNPDIIGVEIRAEDIDSSLNYLMKNYPYEMYEIIARFSDKLVVGIDWLGDEIAGRAIPENYWKDQSSIKELERKLMKDPVMVKRLSVMNSITNVKRDMTLKCSLIELNDGRYDLVNYIYYEQLKDLFNNTEYSALTDFYQKRDEKIAENLIRIIENNPGKRILIMVGADHRNYSLNKITERFGNDILLKK